jgi:hypothetical protein
MPLLPKVPNFLDVSENLGGDRGSWIGLLVRLRLREWRICRWRWGRAWRTWGGRECAPTYGYYADDLQSTQRAATKMSPSQVSTTPVTALPEHATPSMDPNIRTLSSSVCFHLQGRTWGCELHDWKMGTNRLCPSCVVGAANWALSPCCSFLANRSSLVRLRPHLEAATWLGNVHLMTSKLEDTNRILESIWLHREKRFGGDRRKKLGPSSSMLIPNAVSWNFYMVLGCLVWLRLKDF